MGTRSNSAKPVMFVNLWGNHSRLSSQHPSCPSQHLRNHSPRSWLIVWVLCPGLGQAFSPSRLSGTYLLGSQRLYPSKRITVKDVIEALVQFFTRYGLAKEVQTDQGSNFTSKIFRRVLEHLGIKQLRSSACHPESRGALEGYHQTLKTMLRAYCLESPDDWDKGIPLILFATRDAPNEATRYSPLELVYGHEVRGPLKFVKEILLCEGETHAPNLLDFVSSFRERLLKV